MENRKLIIALADKQLNDLYLTILVNR